MVEGVKLHPKYQLKETVSSEYQIRTKANVKDSDGTLILYLDKLGKGTELTRNIARSENKPCYLAQLTKIKSDNILAFRYWLKENEIKALNIAGPRESESFGIYSKTIDFLENVIALP